MKRKKETVNFYIFFLQYKYTYSSLLSQFGFFWSLLGFYIHVLVVDDFLPFKKLFVSRNSLKELNWFWVALHTCRSVSRPYITSSAITNVDKSHIFQKIKFLSIVWCVVYYVVKLIHFRENINVTISIWRPCRLYGLYDDVWRCKRGRQSYTIGSLIYAQKSLLCIQPCVSYIYILWLLQEYTYIVGLYINVVCIFYIIDWC